MKWSDYEVLPQYELERRLITCAIMTEENLKDLIVSMNSHEWILPNYTVFQEINKIFVKNKRVTTELLLSEFLKQNTPEFFHEIIGKVSGKVMSQDYKKYKSDLIELITKKKIKKIINTTLDRYDQMSADEIISNLDIKEFRNKLEVSKADIDINEAMFEVMQELEQNDNNGIITGLPNVDKMMGCIQDEELVILTAEPSAGKSTLGLQMLLHNSMKRNKNGIFISLEMSKKIAVRRMMSTVGMIDNNLFKRKPTDEDYQKMLDTQRIIYEHLDKMKLVADLDTCSAEDVRALALSIKRANKWDKIDYILIDYLQYMTGNDNKKEHEVLSSNIKLLKALTIELNCAIIVISSLGQEGKIYGSSVIKFAADHIWKLEKGENFHEKGEVHLCIQKNRNGATFNKELILDGRYLKFYEPDPYC